MLVMPDHDELWLGYGARREGPVGEREVVEGATYLHHVDIKTVLLILISEGYLRIIHLCGMKAGLGLRE